MTENVTFSLANGKRATIKIWGDTSAARAWLSALASDRLEPQKPFTLDDLLAVCEQHQIQMAVLLNAPTSSDASYRLFEKSPPDRSGQALLPWGNFASTTVSGKVALNPDIIGEEAIWQGGG